MLAVTVALLCWLGLPLSTASAVVPDSAAPNSCPAQLVTPAYFYPGAQWQQLIAEPIPGQVVIVDPQSGPGPAADANYLSVVQQATQTGDTLLGYINTFYATSPLATVEAEVSDYASWYHISNIFLDDMSSSASDLGYYQSLSAYIHQVVPSSTVMLNPGDYPDSSYASLGDPLVVYEGPYGTFASTTPPAWTAAYPSSLFAAMVSNVPSDQVATMLSVATAHRDHYVYATDDAVTSTLYESLPSYWPSEIADVAATCGTNSTSTSTTTSPPTSTPTTTTPPTSTTTVTPPTSTTTTSPPTSTTVTPSVPTAAYRIAASNGAVDSVGTAALGSEAGQHLNAPVMGMASTSSGNGYWLAARDGGVFSFGDARFAGSMGAVRLNAGIVGIASDRTTGGYWLLGADGGVFSFNAPFLGSEGGRSLNAPVVGMASTSDGKGYWLVASDGGVFSFGDAHFEGSMGADHLNAPVVGMAGDSATGGYWLVGADGGVFSFDAAFLGSEGAIPSAAPVTGISAASDGSGYWMVTATGSAFGFGSAATGSSGAGWMSLGSSAVAVSAQP